METKEEPKLLRLLAMLAETGKNSTPLHTLVS